MSTRKERIIEILKIAWPLIVANSFWNLQLTIDRLYLGKHSTESLAAAVTVMGVFWTPMALLQQTAAYVMTFVAQYYGAKREHEIGPAVWHSLYISVIGGLLFLLLIPLSSLIFHPMGHTPKVLALEIDYFVALCFSAMPTAIMAAVSGFYTGLGHTRIIIVINCVGMVFNVIFDYLMIFGNMGFPAMGIAGAGYATALANVFAALFALVLIFNRKYELVYKMRSGYKFSGELLKRFLKYGIPSGMQWALEGLAFTVFLIIIGRMPNGDAALAASGIAVTIMMLSVLPTLGLAQAVSVLVGQHLGEKRIDEAVAATWSGLQTALIYMVFISLTFLLIPQFYLSWFHNASNPQLWAQVSLIVPVLLAFTAFFTSFDSMNMIFSFTLKGAGDTRFVSLVALTLPWPLMVLPAWLFRNYNDAVYWAWGAASVFIVTQAGIFLLRFLQGKWKQMSVIS